MRTAERLALYAAHFAIGHISSGHGDRARTQAAIEALLEEQRTFPPPEEFRAQAIVSDDAVYRRAEEDFEAFWARARRRVHRLVQGAHEGARVGSAPLHLVRRRRAERRLELPRQARRGRAGADKVAYHWVGEPEGETRDLTYAELLARGLPARERRCGSLGVRKGDRVGIYMGMVPELPIAMLACARIGAPHVVVFGGFSSESLAERMRDSGAKVLITQDEGWRKGGKVPLKGTPMTRRRRAGPSSASSSSAAPATTSPGTTDATSGGTTLVAKPRPTSASRSAWMRRTRSSSSTPRGRRRSRRAPSTRAPATSCTSRSPTSGSSTSTTTRSGGARPTSAGSPATATSSTGRSNNGTTSVLYEGDPAYPDWDRHWEIVERYKVNSYYTAPTLIRSFVKMGDGYPARHDLSSLRLLGTVGEPINPEAWVWYWKVIGQERCPIVDTWWQTETGGILITPLPGVTTLKPGSATVPFPGIKPEILDEQGDPVPQGAGRFPDDQAPLARDVPHALGRRRALRRQTYFSKYGPETYFTGDGAKQDSDGYFWLMGRIDDVINVAGHRLSTTEIESTLVEHEAVAEAAATRRLRSRPRPADRLLRPPQGGLRAVGRARRGAAPVRRGRRSARSPGRRQCSSETICRRPARGRSCAAC